MSAVNPLKETLESWLQEALKDQKLDPEVDPIHVVLRDLLTRLSNFFIVEQREGSVSIRPLIAETIKNKMTEEEQQLYSNTLT